MPMETKSDADHLRRVARAAARIAEALGLPPEMARDIEQATVVHDVGKAGVKVLAGARSPVLRLAGQIARFRHARWDGIGAPDGCSGEEIPLAARIVAVAAEFDLLTHRVPGHAGWDVDRTLDALDAQAGHRFDPEVVRAFKGIVLESLEAHSLPRLPRLAAV